MSEGLVWILSFWRAPWADLLIDLMTFGSLVLAVVTLYQSRRVHKEASRLKKQALLRIRGPKLLEQLEDLSSDLNDELSSSRPDVMKLGAMMNRTGELVKSLNKKLSNASTSSGEEISKLAPNSNRTTNVKRDAQRVYSRLTGFITRATEQLEDERSELS